MPDRKWYARPLVTEGGVLRPQDTPQDAAFRAAIAPDEDEALIQTYATFPDGAGELSSGDLDTKCAAYGISRAALEAAVVPGGGGGGNSDPAWQLAAGHYESHFDLQVIYPRPDAETNSYARHRWAYPGVKYEIPIGVAFGAWPYRYQKISGPEWLDIEYETLMPDGDTKAMLPGYGILSGTAPEGTHAAETVTVRVTDQTGAFVDVVFSVAVDASQFVFLDPVNGNDATATGAIGSPYKEVSALQDALLGQKVCYVRDTTAITNGYAPSPARQFRYGETNEPIAYVGYPGETVVVNCTGQSGFSNGRVQDAFTASLTVRDTNRGSENAANVRVIQRLGGKVQRETWWRLTNINSFPGTSKNDNYGFIIALDEGISGPGDGHQYLYAADLVGEDMHAEGGSNGPALFQTMACWRNLSERFVVRNSSQANLGFADYKHTHLECEHRAHDFSENNSATRMVRLSAGNESLTSKDSTISYCKVPTGVMMGGAGSNPTGATGMVAFRNSCGAVQSSTGTVGLSSNNVAGSVDAAHTSDGDAIVDIGTAFDAGMNLQGQARSDYLGTKGAEVA